MDTVEKCQGCGQDIPYGGADGYPHHCHICARKLRLSELGMSNANSHVAQSSGGVQVTTLSQPPTTVPMEAVRLQRLRAEMESNENLSMGILGGLAGAIVSAFIWAGVTFFTDFQIGWMAVGIGFAVGYSVRKCGKGVTRQFAIAGAAIALFGCLAGNVLSALAFIANEYEIGFMELLGRTGVADMFELLYLTFSPVDVVFYVLAVTAGYKYSVMKVELGRATSVSPVHPK
jgi:hypothetical protein